MKGLLRWVGPAIGLAGLTFVALELADHWEQVLVAVEGAHRGLLTLGFLVGLMAFSWLGGTWRLTLTVAGHRTTLASAIHQYFVGQLGKYIPGGVWPVVGRAEMARRSGASGTVSYWGTVLAMTLTYLAAMMVAIASLLLDASTTGTRLWQLLAALLPLGIVSLHPGILAAGLRLLRRATGRELSVDIPSWAASVGLLVAYAPAWIGISGSTWLIAAAMATDVPSVTNIVFATSLSWTIGFLVFPVPGGVGVREAVFVAAATSIGSSGLAAAVAVVSRFVFILVDLLGAACATAWWRLVPQSRRHLESGTGQANDV